MARVGLRTQLVDPGPLRFRRRAANAPASARRRLLLPALALTLGACTIVNVRDGDGVRTSYYPGVAVIRVTPKDSTQVVEVKSLGASSLANSVTLGWNHGRIALVPPGRCQLILWRPRTTELDELHALLGPRTEICDFEGEGQ